MGENDSCLDPVSSYRAESGAVCQQVADVIREVLHKRQGASIEPETPEGNSSLSTPMGTSKISSSRIRALLLGKS